MWWIGWTTTALMIAGGAMAMMTGCSATGATAAGATSSASAVEPVQREPGPRKVVVGTTIYSIWQGWPGLEARLAQLGAQVDEMAATARREHEAGLDLAVLTEYAVTAGREGDAGEVALQLDGPVRAFFAGKAREHQTYIIVPMILAEDRARDVYSNAAVLFDRQGEVAGIYRKVYCVAAPGQDELEGGLTPGTQHKVFETDFGRLGIQICWDMAYDEGWRELAEAGAEIVAWPSASPQTIRPALRAHEGRYYLVSSTPRNNATIFDPLGQVVAQVRSDAVLESGMATLVTQVDLDYEILGWQAKLGNGRAFDEAYGGRAGYRYSEAEDGGVFWSNDPDKPISAMVDALGLERWDDAVERNRRLRERVLEAAGRP